MLRHILKRGVFNTVRILLLAVLMLTLVIAGSRLIMSIDEPQGELQGVVNPAPINNGSLNWANLDFSGLPYASNSDGQFDRFVNCASGGCVPTFDLRGTWLTQDTNFMAWKITGKNFSNATFCGRIANLSLEIEFDADGSVSTGCRAGTDTCYPGADYKVIVNASGNGSLNIFSSSTGPACSGNACFNLSNNVSVFVNISKNVNGTCDSEPSVVRVAINRSHMKWSVLTFNVVTKSEGLGPIDLLGANRQEFNTGLGMSTGNFHEAGGNSSFMFKDDGCGSFNNESYCTNGTRNGNFSCVWESDFNHCRPNFEDTGSYGCSDFCGACTTQADCNTGSRGTCKWSGTFCTEDFEKFRYGGNCDDKCFDCFNNNSCISSRASGGCTWLTDQVVNESFCAEAGTIIKGCGPNTEATSCFNCNATGCISSGNSGLCAWENTSNFCYYNIAGTEYSCFDGADNNANGLVDCKDPSCSSDKFCGGSEFEKKLLTDVGFVTAMKSFGICQDTSSGLSCDKEQAMTFESMRGMDEKPGPPIRLKEDTDLDIEPSASYTWLNLLGFGFKDMGKSIGMGIMLANGTATAVCTNSQNGTGLYYYFLNTDSNDNTGCWATISNKNVTGIEYRFVYNISYNNSAQKAIEVRQAYRCLTNGSTTFGLYPAKLSTPVNPFQPAMAPLCMFGAAIIVVPLTDIGNPKKSIVYHLASVDNVTATPARANDTIYNATYTPGAVDFFPPDCEKNPFACGAAFAKIGGGRFTPFEDCATGSPDEDQDGTSNCDDTDCVQVPWCSGNRAALLANDKTAPRVLTNIIDEFGTFAMLRQSTSEPSNLSMSFYHNVSSCTVVRANLTDAVAGSTFEIDRYKPWHSIIFDNTSITDTNMTPLKQNVTYYYRTTNCDLSNNCAVSACLNFTTKASSASVNFNFGLIFDPLGSSAMSGLNLTYFNGSEYVRFSIRNITYISNTTMRLDNANTSFNGSTLGWNIEFEGVDIAKATSINLTGMMLVTQVNESPGVGKPTDTRMLVGMNGTKWQEIAQVLGIDSVVVNISQAGDRIIKCDTNGSGCVDVTNNVTVLKRGSNYTTIRIPTYGLGGFSAYGVNNTGVLLQSDRTSYQCYPGCTVYFNVTSYQSNQSGPFNVVVALNDTAASGTYNISFLNLSDPALGQWVNTSTNNLTNITNYNFSQVNSGRLNYTVHQFKVAINLTSPVAERITFNITLSNLSPVASFSDLIWLDTVNITNPGNDNVTTDQTPDISFRLFTLNDTTQTCTLRINGTSYVMGNATNATLLTFTVNQTLVNGSHSYNISCANSETNDVGNSTVQTIRINDVTKPVFNQSAPTASVTSSTAATITWTTDERTNTTLSYGTSSTSFTQPNQTETGFSTGHSISLSGLTASTTYHYNITACDNNGNCNATTGGPHSFTTSSGTSGSSSGGGGSSSSGGGVGTNVTVDKVSKLWSEMPAGLNVMNIAKTTIAFRKLTIDAAATVKNAEVTITKLDKAPTTTGAAPGTAYQYLDADTKNIAAAEIKSVVIQFSVQSKWLTTNSVIRDKVALYRYSGGKWNKLATTITGEDTINVNYEAASPGFSTFAVAGEGAAAKTPSAGAGNETTLQNETQTTGAAGDEKKEETPGAEKPSLLPTLETIKGLPLVNIIAVGIVLLAAAGVVVYLVSRKKGKEGG